jgi:SAM-dependent methyltransferase
MPAEWPGRERREPPRRSPTDAVRAPLAAWLRAEAGRLRPGSRVLDVGCGVKPYYPFFAEAASEYVGVDVAANGSADLEGSVEALPVADASFDIVLCTQVLEHADDPGRAVRELRRVVAPGGRVLASTHGVQVYHPAPQDLWRWTHAGLERLFRGKAEWASLTIAPGSGTTACLGMLAATYVHVLAKRAHAARAARPAVAAINAVAAAVDERVAMLRELRPGAIFANDHVTAVA